MKLQRVHMAYKELKRYAWCGRRFNNWRFITKDVSEVTCEACLRCMASASVFELQVGAASSGLR